MQLYGEKRWLECHRDYMNWIRAGLEHWNLWDEASIESFVQQAEDVLREHSNDSGNDWNYSVDEYWKDRNGQTQDDEEFEEEPDEEPQKQPPKAQDRRTEEFHFPGPWHTHLVFLQLQCPLGGNVSDVNCN
ncbi:hypothetical protein AFCA_010762 [Aspergillus flavus]|nr:hypothetical protein NYO67_3677 [Aspergillus flavus]RAQ68111.1 hypothetical protein COH21_013052 [Aspergillus flavus]UDD63498.1 hypothetical protein AFCA_010762 [Aspergillus flavus]